MTLENNDAIANFNNIYTSFLISAPELILAICPKNSPLIFFGISLHPSIIDLPAYALARSLPWHWASDWYFADTYTDMLLQGGESADFLGFDFRTQARSHLLCRENSSPVCAEPHRAHCVEYRNGEKTPHI